MSEQTSYQRSILPLQFWRHFLEHYRWTNWRNWLSDKEKLLQEMSRPVEQRDWEDDPELVFHISLAESGRPKLVFPNFEAEVDISLKYKNPEVGLFNYEWVAKIVNEPEIPDKFLEQVKKLSIAAISFQSRNITGCSIAFFQNQTLDSLALQLYHFQFSSQEEQENYEKLINSNQ